MRIIEDNQLSKIFLQAQQNLAKMLLGDDFLLLMYFCKSPMRQRGPQTSAGSLGEERASFGVVAPRNRRRRCHVLERLEAGESEQSSTRQIPPLILCLFSFFPSCWVQISGGRMPGCPEDHRLSQQEAPRHTGRGTRGAEPSTRSFVCTWRSTSPSSGSSGFKAKMTQNGTWCPQAPNKAALRWAKKHPCPAQSSRTSSLTCNAASRHCLASPTDSAIHYLNGASLPPSFGNVT